MQPIKPCAFTSILMLVVLVASGCTGKQAEKETTRLRFLLDWKPSVQFLGYYSAFEKGFYRAEGLDVVFGGINTPQDISDLPYKVETGEYDLGTGSTALAVAQAKGADIVSVASIYQYGPHVLFAKKGAGINTIRDFKGRTIADKGDSWRVLTDSLMRLEGLTIADAKLVPVSFDLTPFYEGKVDIWAGYLLNEVPQARLRGNDLVTFPLYEYGIINLGGSIYTSRKYLKAHEDRVVKFLRASIKGWDWAVQNPAQAVDLFMRMFPEETEGKDFLRASFAASIPLIRPDGRKIGYIDVKEYDALLRNNYHSNTDGHGTDELVRKIHEAK